MRSRRWELLSGLATMLYRDRREHGVGQQVSGRSHAVQM